MAIKLGTQSPSIMLVTGNGDLSAISLLDTNPINPVSRQWSISYWPDNLTSAPTIAANTSNPASFTPPQAGEWYVVRLVRTLLVGTEILELPICVPDVTGAYALPPPGVPADTDPTKTIVNLNDDAKIVGWAGGKRASLPGLSGAVRKAITDSAAANTPASAANPGTQSIQHYNRTAGQWLSIEETGFDIQAAHDALPSSGGSIFCPDGDHTVSVTLTFTKPVRLILGRGIITLAAGGIVAHVNLTIIGHGESQSVLACHPGGKGIVVPDGFNGWVDAGPNPGFTEGAQAIFLARFTFSGGQNHIDASLATGFFEGDFHVENVTFQNSTGISVVFNDSVYYGRFIRCQWITNYTALWIGAFCETKIEHCIIKQSASGSASVVLNGSHHTEFKYIQFYGFAGNTNPDVLCRPVFNGTAGYCEFNRVKFSPERELSMNSARTRIQLYDPDVGNTRFGMTCVRVVNCEFLGPPGMAVATVGRGAPAGVATNVAKVTTNTAHGLQVGDKFHHIACSDATFNGEWTVLATPTTTSVTFANTGSDLAPTSLGGNAGLLASSMLAPVLFSSPPTDWVFDGNHFENYPFAINDDFTEQGTDLDRQGRCVWLPNNYMTGNVSSQCQEFRRGGHNFVHFLPGPASPHYALDSRDRERETPEIRNRVIKSQSLDTWSGNVGPLTITAGQTDPWGGTAAAKLARIGANPVVSDAGGDVYTAAEALTCGFDQTGLPTTCFLSFWAKAGSTRSLFVMIKDGGGFAHFHTVFNLGSEWKRYKVPVTWNSGSPTLQLVISPGLRFAMFGDCYVTGVQISDYDSDYYPTDATELHDTTVGLRLSKNLMLGTLGASDIVVTDASKRLTSLAGGDFTLGETTVKGIKASGSAPTVSSVVDAIGSTGTMTLKTGSKDIKGTIILTPSGSGIGNYAWPKIVFTRTLSNPTFKATLRAGTGTWGGGAAGVNLSTVEIFSSGVDTAEIGFIATNAKFDTGTGLVAAVNFTSGSTYLIDYEVIES